MNRNDRPFVRLFIIYVLAIALLGVLIAIFWPSDLFSQNPPASNPPITEDTLFMNKEREEIPFTAFRGQPVLLHFWATWCGPCIEELPQLDSLQARYEDSDLRILAVAQERDNPDLTSTDRVRAFYAQHGIKNLEVWTDSRSIGLRNLKVSGLPTTLLVDRQGRIHDRLEGVQNWESVTIQTKIAQLLAQ